MTGQIDLKLCTFLIKRDVRDDKLLIELEIVRERRSFSPINQADTIRKLSGGPLEVFFGRELISLLLRGYLNSEVESTQSIMRSDLREN